MHGATINIINVTEIGKVTVSKNFTDWMILSTCNKHMDHIPLLK
jgi:hypothetical protein